MHQTPRWLLSTLMPDNMDSFIRYNIPLSDLKIREITSLTGPGFGDEINRITDLFKKIDASAGYSIFDRAEVSLRMGVKISKIFEKGDKIALFVVTLGNGYEKIADTYRGDTLLYYLTDVIASEYTEAVAGKLTGFIAQYASSLGMRVSNRYSPGYCGWSVSGQKALFGYLPAYPCGIELNDSSLMKPVKSISGAVAIGKNVKFHKYDCSTCSDEECLYRKKFIL